MLKVGIAGIGFMGWIHWLAYQQIAGVEVVAICDQDSKRLSGDWTGINGNFGPPGEKVDLSGVESFKKLESFCSSDCDLIDICLPPALHSVTISKAAGNGKHVFCEKPLALNIPECDAAIESCNQAQRMLMIGHVLPYFPEYRFALDTIQSGIYGKLISAHFKRIISDPTWLPDFYDSRKVGGPLFDLHIHDAHFIRLTAGMPTSVVSSGRFKKGVVKFCHSIFEFEDQAQSIVASSGVIDQQGRPFTHGYEIQLEKATLHFEYAALESGDEMMPLKIIQDDGTVSKVAIDSSDPVDAFVAEISDVVAAIRDGKPSTILCGETARDAVRICEAESESVKAKSRVEIK